MALLAILDIMAALARLWIILGLDWMHIDPVAPVALRLIVTTKITLRKVISRTSAGVAVEAEFLAVALIAVLDRLARYYPVPSDPVAVVVGSDTF
jgi:hypothetical protein